MGHVIAIPIIQVLTTPTSTFQIRLPLYQIRQIKKYTNLLTKTNEKYSNLSVQLESHKM